MSKRERDGGGGGGGGGDEEDGDLYGAESVVTGNERGGGGEDLHTSEGKRHGIEPESDEDYKV